MGQPFLKRNRTVTVIVLVSAILFCLNSFALNASVSDRSSSRFYTTEYGSVNPTQSPAVEQAFIVFNRLLEASSYQNPNKVNLIVLPRTAANWENWAMSLPDGSIVLVENILDICFDDGAVFTEKGKARLAFILAHELSHIIARHHSVLNQKDPLQFQKRSSAEKPHSIASVEAQADYSGLILMTMATYEPRYLIDKSNFFLDYVNHVAANYFFEDHQTPQQRMVILKEKLNPLINELPLFASGVRFYRQQEYRKAIESFQQFASLFPGREVYNNIGLAFYQLALQDLARFDSKNLYRFMLSTLVDSQTLAYNLIPDDLGKARSFKQPFQENLEQARINLELSISKDPDYTPAKLNLSSVLITAQEAETAINLLQEILYKQPTNTDALNNKAVALYLSSPEEHSQQAISVLELVAESQTGSSARFSRYNKARILSEQLQCTSPVPTQKTGDCLTLARKSWSPFLNSEQNSPYTQRVKLELGYEKPVRQQFSEQKRVALVIGNSAYQEAPLLNPANDAHSMKNTLEQLGFDVLMGLNLNRIELLRIINRFGDSLTPDSTGLFYYSGHGLQVGGENFLLPIGAEIIQGPQTTRQKEEHLRYRAVGLQVLMQQLENARNVQNIVILDACRDNPLPDLEDQFQGFAEMNAPARTYIAYSTSPGKTAWDGLDGENGIFTSALLNHIGQPNMDIHKLFQTVRKEVADKTGQHQTTWDLSTLDEAFTFNPPKPQDWTWHIAAGTIALLTAWQSVEEAKEYRRLNSENSYLREKYSNSITLEDYIKIREQYSVNQERMKTHKKNYETLDLITAAAVLWGGYLLFFKTYDEGIYDISSKAKSVKPLIMTISQTNTFGIQLQWQW